MLGDYKLTKTILDQVYEFTKLYERLAMLPENHPWVQQVVDIENRKSALAAVSADKTAFVKIDFSAKDFDPFEHIEPRWHAEYRAYKQALEHIPELFPVSEPIDMVSVQRTYKAFAANPELQSVELRTQPRELSKVVVENNVYKTVKLQVQTPATEIAPRLAELFEWLALNQQQVNPLLLAGISHVNIAAIHPFPDGNGRLARLLDNGLLYRHGIEYYTLVALEEYYLLEFEDYFAAIEDAIATQDLTRWLEFYTAGMLAAVNVSIGLLHEISGGAIDLLNRRVTRLTAKEVAVIDVMRAHNTSNGAEIADYLKVTRSNVNVIVNRLVTKGILRKVGRGPGTRFELQ